MSNDIFQFSVTRPFQQRSLENSRHLLLNLYWFKSKSDLYENLKRLKAAEDRSGMIQTSQEYINSDKFILKSHRSKSPIQKVEEWLAGKGGQVKYENLIQKVDAIFKELKIQDWKNWILGKDFIDELVLITDNLISLSIGAIDDKESRRLRPRLISRLRCSKLLEELAKDEPSLKIYGGIKRVFNAMVIYPKEIFPLPPKDNKKEKEKVLEDFKKISDRFEQQKNKALALVNRLDRLNAAKSEIKKVFDQISKPQRIAEINQRMAEISYQQQKPSPTKKQGAKKVSSSSKPKSANPINTPTFWVLTDGATGKLSKDVQKTITDLGRDIKNIHVRDTIFQIESEILDISEKLRTFNPYERVADSISDLKIESPVIESSTIPNSKGNVQPIGYNDYFVVREKIAKYVPGEIAHIENVLKGEKKSRTHRRMNEQEDILFLESEKTQESQQELQSTDRFELQTNAEKSLQETIHAQAGVDANYKGVNFEVKANAGFTYDRATQESNSQSIKIAHEVIEKSVKNIRESVIEQRTMRTKEVVEEINIHEIDNTKLMAGHISGIYRWVDKIYKVEIVNIGRRLMFEFIIPEPAAFYKYACKYSPKEGVTMEEPQPPIFEAGSLAGSTDNAFLSLLRNPMEMGMTVQSDQSNLHLSTRRPLSPGDLDEKNYLDYVTQYNVQDIEPPPALYIIKSTLVNEKPELQTDNDVPRKIEPITIDDGYQAKSAQVGGTYISHIVAIWGAGYMRVTVGTNFIQYYPSDSIISEIAMNNEEGKIPITIVYFGMAAIGITIEVTCERTQRKMEQWQIKTYNSIMNAYYELKNKYEEQLRAAQIKAGIEITGRNPLKNQGIIEMELKKIAISLITGQDFRLFDAMRDNGCPQGYPQLDMAEAQAEGKYMQFFEQAFEWHNLSYIFYPYFWGRKGKWMDFIHESDNDPLFEKFLQAGAARALVSVRPTYEHAVDYFLHSQNGDIWEGGDPPHVEDDMYVSIADSIKEEQGHVTTEGVGELSVQKNNDRVTGTGTEFTEEDDEGREIIIRGKTYRIKRVDELDQIVLNEKYMGEDEDKITYELGEKYVGEPWEVKVPTSLVWLQPDSTLPDSFE